jgi:hypothetical protein
VVIQASSDIRQMGADGAAGVLSFWGTPKGDDCGYPWAVRST